MAETVTSRSGRLAQELRKYALISTYLFICFSVLLLYETSLTAAPAGDPVPWSLALVKALVLGKFILIGEALSVGAHADSYPLLHRILWKSVAMLAVLVVFKALEELIIGWLHEQTAAQVLNEFLERSGVADVAPLLLMLLILVPLISATEIYGAVGGERFRQLLTER